MPGFEPGHIGGRGTPLSTAPSLAPLISPVKIISALFVSQFFLPPRSYIDK